MKKTISLILSIFMLIGALGMTALAQENDINAVEVYVTVSKHGEIVTDKSNNAVAMAPVGLSGEETYDLDDVFLAVHDALYEEGTAGYETDTGDYGLYVSKFWGDTSGNFTYQVNFGSENVWGPTHEIEDGDYVEFCINKNSYPDTEVYTRFDTAKIDIYVEETVDLVLSQANYTADGMSFFECPDATITINGLTTEYMTDADGKVSIEFGTPGKHVVSAIKTKNLGEEIVPAIEAPVCEVTVNERPEARIMHNIVEKYMDDSIVSDGNMYWFIADFADYLTIYPESDYSFTEAQKQSCVNKIIDFAFNSTSQGDLSKAIISLRALGYDAKNTYTKKGEAFDIVAKLIGLINAESVMAPYYEYTLPYVLIALQQGEDYATAETIGFLIDFAITNQTTWQDTTFGVDGATAMLRALAPYYETNTDVKAVVDQTVDMVIAYQGEDGSMGNAASTGIAMAGLSAVGIDVKTVVNRNGKSMIDGLMIEANENLDGFLPADNSFGTEQGLRGLNAWKLFGLNKVVYDFNDYPTNEARATLEVMPPIITGGGSGNGSSSTEKDEEKDKEQNKAETSEVVTEQMVGLQGKNPDVTKKQIVYADKTFDDIESHKNMKAIKELASRGVVNGIDNKNYCPDDTMTRAEFAAIVVRALGVPQQSGQIFKDVAENDWFNIYVNTAYSYGIVNGVSATEFEPQGKITREEAATMVSRAAKLCGMEMITNEDGIRNTLAQFPDYITSSDWAMASLAFCYNESIFDKDETEVKPTAKVTRAEVAQMLYNMLEKAKLI